MANSTWKDWIRPDGIDDLEALGFVGDTSYINEHYTKEIK